MFTGGKQKIINEGPGIYNLNFGIGIENNKLHRRFAKKRGGGQGNCYTEEIMPRVK